MKAIIVAGGMGTRLKPLTDTSPKCLTEVNGKTILENMLFSLSNSEVDMVYVVTGYHGSKIKEKFGSGVNGIPISYVENPIYTRTNTTYPLWLVLKDLSLNENEILLTLEGDVFLDRDLVLDFIRHPSIDSTVVELYRPYLDGSFVDIDLKSGLVTDWTHKSFRPENYVVEDKYKTVNIHKFSRKFVEGFLFPTLEEHVKANGGTKPIEYVLQDIIKNKKGRINTFLANNYRWIEIDDLGDLRMAESMFK